MYGDIIQYDNSILGRLTTKQHAFVYLYNDSTILKYLIKFLFFKVHRLKIKITKAHGFV